MGMTNVQTAGRICITIGSLLALLLCSVALVADMPTFSVALLEPTTPSPTSPSRIDEQTAIAQALQIASRPYIHLSGAAERPTNIQAVLLRLYAVPAYLKQLGWPEDRVGHDSRADADVWLVTMDGDWGLIGGPVTRAGAAPPQMSFHHYAIVINATTGQDMGVKARP
jgi:hypothetical protein